MNTPCSSDTQDSMIPYMHMYKAACTIVFSNVYKYSADLDTITIRNFDQTYKSALSILLVGSEVVVVDDYSFIKNEESLLDAAHTSLSADLEHHAFVNGRLRGEFR